MKPSIGLKLILFFAVFSVASVLGVISTVFLIAFIAVQVKLIRGSKGAD